MRHYTRFFAPVLAAVMLLGTSCARQGSEDDVAHDMDEGGTAPALDEQAAIAAQEADLRKSLPAAQITPVDISVTLSPAAKAAFASNGETIQLEVIYGGDPTQEGQSRINELGVVELGRVRREVKDGETVTLSEDVLDKQLLDLTIGQPQVMVNVTSGRKTSADNLLACDFYWETLSVAGTSGVNIPCKLLSEVAQ